MQTAINAASGLLPKDLPIPPTYKKVNPADFPVLIYARPFRRDAALQARRLRLHDPGAAALDRARRVAGLGVGQKKYAARVQVNPGALAARGIGLEDVRNALVAATVEQPEGHDRGRAPVHTLDTNDQLFNAAQFDNVIIAYRNGAPVRVKDVGQAVDSVQNLYVGAWFDDQPAEGIAIQRASGANTIELVEPHQGDDAASGGVDPAIRACRA